MARPGPGHVGAVLHLKRGVLQTRGCVHARTRSTLKRKLHESRADQPASHAPCVGGGGISYEVEEIEPALAHSNWALSRVTNTPCRTAVSVTN